MNNKNDHGEEQGGGGVEEKGNPHRSSVTRLSRLRWHLAMGAQLRPFTSAPVPGACFQEFWGAPIPCRGHRPPHPMPSWPGEQEGEGGGTAPAPSAAGREPPFHTPAPAPARAVRKARVPCRQKKKKTFGNWFSSAFQSESRLLVTTRRGGAADPLPLHSRQSHISSRCRSSA